VTRPVLERPLTRRRLLILAALLGLAVNLRTAVGSLGVVLPDLRSDLRMSGSFTGLLTTVPVICFAVFGMAANRVVVRHGLHRTVALALVLAAAGMLSRPYVEDRWLFLLLTTGSLAGAALGNVCLPALAKRHFPTRLPLVSSLYGAVLLAGAALSSAVTVPLADALGGWPQGLMLWGALAALLVLPWIGLAVHDRPPLVAAPSWPLRRIARVPMAWWMALLFGSQSAQAYTQFGWYPEMLVDSGLSPARAALMLGVVSAVSIPLTLTLPLGMRHLHGAALPLAYAVIAFLGWLGVLLAPQVPALLSAVLLGAGSTAFTWVLALIAERARTTEGTVALSGFVQGMGYLIAALGPLGTGVLHDLTGSWTPSLLGMMALATVFGVVGVALARPRTVEDELAAAEKRASHAATVT
jgi:CP family cyanate transporter-like MFS transporter